jgi:DNA-binding transcriptional ArsR family regulator
MLKQRAEELDVIIHALSDPSRRSIVERLSQGCATVSDLAAPLPMSMPAVLLDRLVAYLAGTDK